MLNSSVVVVWVESGSEACMEAAEVVAVAVAVAVHAVRRILVSHFAADLPRQQVHVADIAAAAVAVAAADEAAAAAVAAADVDLIAAVAAESASASALVAVAAEVAVAAVESEFAVVVLSI